MLFHHSSPGLSPTTSLRPSNDVYNGQPSVWRLILHVKLIMKNLAIILGLLLIFQIGALAQTKTDPEKKLKELGIVLKKPPVPVANYVPAVQVGKLVYLSGQGPRTDEGEFIKGKVGAEISVEDAQKAARLTGIRLLEALKGQIGDLNKVKRIVKVLVVLF